MKHRYFVSYCFVNNLGEVGFGAGEVVLDREIDSWDLLMAAVKKSAGQEGATNGVTPIAWKEFSEEVAKTHDHVNWPKCCINLGELKAEAEKLLVLLGDPQPGPMLWNDFMRVRLQSLHALIAPALDK